MGDSMMKKSELKDIYSSSIGFYRSMRYLVASGYVEKVEIKNNVVFYRLTLAGQLLARLLCSLDDNPEEIKNLKFVINF